MATVTPIAKISVVHIITVMATAARTGQHHLLRHRLLMAVVALIGYFLMRAVQLEIGLVVVEVPSLPRARRVADLAFGSQFAFVHVILFMARPAIGFRIFEGWSQVALLAADQCMLTQQRECRHAIVIELVRLDPRFFHMTGLTLLAFLSFVLVVLLVAREAIHRQFLLV